MSDFEDFVSAIKGGSSKPERGGDDFAEFAQAVKFGAPKPDPLAADTAALKAGVLPQVTASSLGDAVQSDASGFTLGNIAHHGVPILLQMIGTALGGQAGGKVGQVIGSGLGSGAGYLYQSGAEPLAKGEAPTTTATGLLGNAALGAGMEGGMQGVGAVGRTITGKGMALAEGEAAGQAALAERADLAVKATGEAEAATQAATGKVQTAQEAVNREMLKHSEDAFQGVKDAEVERMVKEGLGPQADIQRPITPETLTAAVRPPQAATNDAVKGVFGGISQKFQTALDPYADLPVQSSLRATAKIIRDDITTNGDARLSPAMDTLMKSATGSDIAAVRVRGATETDAQKIVNNLRRAGNDQAADDLAMKFGLGAANKGDTVGRMMGFRSQFVDQLHSKRAIDRRAAASMIDAIDGDVAKVTPPELETQLGALRDEWHTAKSTLSDAFRNRLFRASSPDQVAEAIYTGAKTGSDMSHRGELLVNQISKEAPEQLPVLRQSFAKMVANAPSATAEIQKMPPGLFKAMFPKTGFDTPKGWVEALQGQSTFKQIAGSPELQAKYQSIFQQGMNSLGTRAKQDALASAESHLRGLPSSQDMIANALKDTSSPGQAFQQGAMEGMKQPILGKGINNYVEHKVLWLGSLAMLGAGHYSSHPGYMAMPLAYLASSKGLSMALSNPTLGRMYYNALTSKTAEQGMFWLGRLTTAALSEAARSQSK